MNPQIVIIIEDSPILLSVLREEFCKFISNYHLQNVMVKSFSEPKECLSFIEHSKDVEIQAFISNIRLDEEMSGFQIAQILSERDHPPLIYFMARSVSKSVPKLYPRLKFKHIVKPISISDIEKVCSEILVSPS